MLSQVAPVRYNQFLAVASYMVETFYVSKCQVFAGKCMAYEVSYCDDGDDILSDRGISIFIYFAEDATFAEDAAFAVDYFKKKN